jgi:uncharacterized protein YciU (UPF0263 family)
MEVSVHRDLNTVLSAWGDASRKDPTSAMMLHVGFDRPETDLISRLLEDWSSRVLVTESSRWSLPTGFESSVEPVATTTITGRQDPLRIYLGLEGWGYLIANEKHTATLGTVSEPWLLLLQNEHGIQYGFLHELGVTTDQQYVEKRKQLPIEIRDEIDDFRFVNLLSSTERTDPFALLRIAPDWLLHFPISSFDDLPLRSRNAFRRVGIELIGEIQRFTPEYLLALENFGKKSYETLAPAILAIATRKPHQNLIYSRDHDFAGQHQQTPSLRRSDAPSSSLVPVELVQYRTLWAGVQMTLDQMAPRVRIVLEGRLGREETPKTLDVLGAMLGVSRERARQLEAKGMEEFTERSWLTELTRRLGARFTGRREPLFLDLLSVEDKWFEGFEGCISFLGQLIERLHEGVYWAWPLSGRLILARLRATEWDALERSTRFTLAAQTGAGLTPSDVRLFIEAAASTGGCAELVDALTAALWEDLQFARDPELSNEVLIGVGRNVRSVVAAIMAESDEAMDLRTIGLRCAERIGQVPSDMAIRNALNTIGAYPFSGRRYTLDRHLGISEAEMRDILADVEQVLAAGPSGKQWHCTEILAELRDEHLKLPPQVDQYVLNIILRRSERARYLGRFVWVPIASGASTTKDRLDIADLIVGVLEQAGRPLSTADLKSAISSVRGLNTVFQVFPSEKVARVDAGLWGLVDRDFSLSAVERSRVLDRLERVLEEREKALHVTEIRDTLAAEPLSLPDQVTNEMLLGLSQTDRRFRVAGGQLLGLSHWNSLNRLNARGAIRQAAREQGNEISTVLLYQRVDELAERKVERSVIHAELRGMRFAYNAQNDCWCLEADDIEE